VRKDSLRQAICSPGMTIELNVLCGLQPSIPNWLPIQLPILRLLCRWIDPLPRKRVSLHMVAAIQAAIRCS
jgi:hypothetical protein